MDQSAFKEAVKSRMEKNPFRAKIGKYKKGNIDSSVQYINKILTDALDEVCPMMPDDSEKKEE